MFRTPILSRRLGVSIPRLLVVFMAIAGGMALGRPVLAEPVLVSTASLDGQTVALCFESDLDKTSAESVANYTVSGATVESAVLLEDQRTLLLSVSGLAGTTFTVEAKGVADAQGQTADVTGTGSVLGWTVQDLGELPVPSMACACSPSAIRVVVDGGTVWFNTDSGNLVDQARSGDFDVRVQVSKVEGGGPNSNMILDARESAQPGSRHVGITVYPTQRNWTSFRRMEDDGASSVLDGNWRIAWPEGIDFPNAWLRLKRSGDTFTAYGSTDGVDWVQVGDAYTPDPPYAQELRVGLATGVTDATVPPLQVEFSNFGTFALTNVVIVIVAQPQDVTVIENQPASFTVNASLQEGPSGALTYQWQRNGVDIPGANAATYTLPLATLADQSARFTVRVSAPGGEFLDSAPAVLNVQADTTAPKVASTAGLAGNNVAIVFDKLMDPASAQDVTKYSLSGGTAIVAATLLEDQQTIVLQVPELSGASYTMQVAGVRDLAGNAATATVTGEILNFNVQDMGNLPTPSFVYARSSSAIDVQVDGGAIWFNSDSGNFISQSRSGDFDIRVQVNYLGGGTANSNMILDARESGDPGSRHVAITVYPVQRNWTAFRRIELEGASSVLDGNWRIPWPAGVDFPNTWLRLKRSGATFTTYGSTDGLEWVQIGDPYTPDPSFADDVLVGMASAVTDGGAAPLRAEYSNFGTFALTNAVIEIASQPQDAIVQENHAVTFSVSAVLQNGPAGALTYQWQRDGVDIPGAAGASYTLALPTLADQGARFRVRVSAPGATPVDSDAAILTVQPDNTPPGVLGAAALASTMVTVCFDESLEPGSASDPSRYSITGGVSVETATLQADGQTVLLGVTGISGNTFTLSINGVADLKGNPADSTVSGNAAGLASLDVGEVVAPQIVLGCSTNQFQVLARGADIWAFTDSFGFLYQPMTGNFDVQVQIESVSLVNGATRGGLMAREDETSGSRNVFVGTYPAQGDNHWVATARESADGDTIILPDGYVVREPGFAFPNAWVRLKRSGSSFTTYHSTNGVDWVQLGAIATPDPAYPATVLVGIASSSIDAAGNPGDQYASFTYSHYGSTPAVIPAPELEIAAALPEVRITWPASATGFQIQQTSRLGAGVSWVPVTQAPVQVGDRFQLSIPAPAGVQFFRLAR